MFKFKKNKERLLQVPKERSIYAFTKHRRGDFILYLGKNGDGVYDFMQLPDRYKLSLTAEEFTDGITSTLLDFVEQLPEDVFEVSRANIQVFEKIA